MVSVGVLGVVVRVCAVVGSVGAKGIGIGHPPLTFALLLTSSV